MTLMLTLALSTAHAEDVPLSTAQRNLTLGQRDFVVGLSPALVRGEAGVGGSVTVPIRFGVTDDIEIFLGPRLQSFEPRVSDPLLGARYSLFIDDHEVGFQVAGDLAFFGPERHVTLDFGMPMRFHLEERLAIDLGLFVRTQFVPSIDVGFRADIGARFNPIPQVGLHLDTGIHVDDMAYVPQLSIPMWLSVFYTLPQGEMPRVDAGLWLGSPDLRTRSEMVVGLTARFFLLGDQTEKAAPEPAPAPEAAPEPAEPEAPEAEAAPVEGEVEDSDTAEPAEGEAEDPGAEEPAEGDAEVPEEPEGETEETEAPASEEPAPKEPAEPAP